MSPLATREEQTGVVYVLRHNIRDRPVVTKPYTNAERPDTDLFYLEGVYDAYPYQKRRYEERRRREERKAAAVREWALKAIEARRLGLPTPPNRRQILVEVFDVLWDAGPDGLSRPEICLLLRRDGGKVSGALTDLHAAGVIFPLEGVRRSKGTRE